MTKGDLVEVLAEKADLPKRASELVIDTLFASIASIVSAGERVELRGFGSFRLRIREARAARNPKTGEKVRVPKKRVPVFKAGKKLRDAVNEGRTRGGLGGCV